MRACQVKGSEDDSSIWQGITRDVDQLYCYEVKCPACQKYHLPDVEHIVVPDGETDPRLIRSRKLARYRCPECKYAWSDHTRDIAVRNGRWRPYVWTGKHFEPAPVIDDAISVGYHMEIKEGQSAEIEGRLFEGPLRVSTQWKIFELSLCPIGADDNAKIRAEMAPNKSATAQQAGKERTMNERLRAKLRELFRALGITDEEPAQDPAQDPAEDPEQKKEKTPAGDPVDGEGIVDQILEVLAENGVNIDGVGSGEGEPDGEEPAAGAKGKRSMANDFLDALEADTATILADSLGGAEDVVLQPGGDASAAVTLRGFYGGAGIDSKPEGVMAPVISVVPMPYTVLLIGQMFTSGEFKGSAAPLTIQRPMSAGEAANLFGQGSMLASMSGGSSSNVSLTGQQMAGSGL